MIYVLLIAAGICALGAALVFFGRGPRRDEVERFHRARAMTTEWSRSHRAPGRVPRQVVEEPVEAPQRQTAQHV